MVAMNKKILKKYAELVVKTGVNLQKKETLVISAPVNAADFVEEIVLSAYKNGASDVEVLWNDEIVSRYGFRYKTKKQLAIISEWEKIQRESFVDKKVAYMAIISDDPENFKGINPEKIAIYRRAKNAAFSKFREIGRAHV